MEHCGICKKSAKRHIFSKTRTGRLRAVCPKPKIIELEAETKPDTQSCIWCNNCIPKEEYGRKKNGDLFKVCPACRASPLEIVQQLQPNLNKIRAKIRTRYFADLIESQNYQEVSQLVDAIY